MTTTVLLSEEEGVRDYTLAPRVPKQRTVPNPMTVPNRQGLQMGAFVGFFTWVAILVALAFGGVKAAQAITSDAAPQPGTETTKVEEKAPADSGQRQQSVHTNGELVCNVTNPHAGTAVRPAACN